MKRKTFDILAWLTITLASVGSFLVAIRSWIWFPTPGDWGHIAEIPPNALNFVALLLPPVLLLCYLLIRRCSFKKESAE